MNHLQTKPRLSNNDIYIWTYTHAETIVEAHISEDPTADPKSEEEFLDILSKCLTYSTLFRGRKHGCHRISIHIKLPLFLLTEPCCLATLYLLIFVFGWLSTTS